MIKNIVLLSITISLFAGFAYVNSMEQKEKEPKILIFKHPNSDINSVKQLVIGLTSKTPNIIPSSLVLLWEAFCAVFKIAQETENIDIEKQLENQQEVLSLYKDVSEIIAYLTKKSGINYKVFALESSSHSTMDGSLTITILNDSSFTINDIEAKLSKFAEKFKNYFTLQGIFFGYDTNQARETYKDFNKNQELLKGHIFSPTTETENK